MKDPKLIEDEHWDHYSVLPNPMWYQHVKELKDDEDEESNTDSGNGATDATK